MGLSSETEIPELWDTLIPVIGGMFADSVCSSLPHHGPTELVSVPRRCTGPYYFTVKSDGLGHGSRSRPRLTSQDFKDQGRVYAITPQTELVDQSVIQGTFTLSRLWARVFFDSSASHSFIVASYVKVGLRV